jgi:hypothetical protein
MVPARNESEVLSMNTTTTDGEAWALEYATCGALTHAQRCGYADRWVSRLQRLRDTRHPENKSGRPPVELPPDGEVTCLLVKTRACEKWCIDASEIGEYANSRARHFWWATLSALYGPTKTGAMVGAQKSSVQTAVSVLRKKHADIAAEAIRYAAELKARMVTANEREEKAA